MCGIIGYAGRRDAAPIIIEGLKKLEYRGYDSAGVALFTQSGIEVIKQTGRVAALEAKLAEGAPRGAAGIGHTRWASHGEPSDANSHPHTGTTSKIAVVHNGVIENHERLRARMESKGAVFTSETDSEAVAHLCEYYSGGGVLDMVINAANRLEGSYALGIMREDCPGTLVAVKKSSPLIVGVCEHGNFIASDVPAVLSHTNRVFYLNDGEIAVLTADGVTFYNFDKELLAKEAETVSWAPDAAEKAGFPHFMLKEIFEQPRVIKATAASAGLECEKTLGEVDITRFNKIIITACGSAFNAGLAARYVFERLLRMPCEVDLASEFRYRDALADAATLVILITQSGETADTIAAMREAKAKGASTLAIVNVMGSTVAKEADWRLFTAAGPEIAVATTKAFSAQLVLLYVIALNFAEKLGKITGEAKSRMFAEISALPEKAEQILKNIGFIQKFAAECVGVRSIFFIGRNIDYAVACEGSLKLKEISYIHSEAYAGGELKHGTISLIEENTLVVALSNCPGLRGKIMSNVEQVMARGAKVLLIGRGAARSERLSSVEVPETAELFSPSLSVIVLQLFAYYVAANKGLDIDKPRNLAKSVTIE